MFGAYNETECLGGGGEIKESKKTESKQQKIK